MNAASRIEDIERLLRHGPKTGAELMAALQISQPTLSRTIQSSPERFTMFRVRGERTPRYGLLRSLPAGVSARQPVSRVSEQGAIEMWAELEFLSGGMTLEKKSGRTKLYEGLPPYMAFAAPTGFLGRQAAHGAAGLLNTPHSLSDWTDDHRAAYLVTYSLNVPGNLIYGSRPLQAEMGLRSFGATAAAGRLAYYEVAANVLRSEPDACSAGGEQPKFLAIMEDAGHVIVKFAKTGTRMAALLPMEQHALACLASVGVPAAVARIHSSQKYVFLEVERFDRVGRHGRVGMLSAGAIDDELFGSRDTWSQFAARCRQRGYLGREDAQRIDIMAAFSELIGNSDRHFENISVLTDDAGTWRVAPAYDILPMRYAPIGAGVDPDLTPVAPRIGTIGAQPCVWARAVEAATQFWEGVRDDRLALPVSPEFKVLAGQCLAAVHEFAAPLLPTRGTRFPAGARP